MTHGWDAVRARNKDTGDHYTTTRHRADLRGDTVLEDRPALDKHGRWLAVTPKKNLTPVRDDHGRFTTPEADSPEDIDEPITGEEEA